MRHGPALLTVFCSSLALAAPASAATIGVDTQADSAAGDGHCSLREAVSAADGDVPVDACPAGAGADTIVLPSGTYTLSLAGAGEDGNATGDLDIASTVTLEGARSTRTIIDANRIDRVLDVRAGANVTLTGLTVSGGRAPSGGTGVDGQNGGGVRNAGTLTLTHVNVSDNTAGRGGAGYDFTGGGGGFGGTGSPGIPVTAGPGGAGGSGGGVYNTGTLAIAASAIGDNEAGDGGAGGHGIGGDGGGGSTGAGGAGGSATGGDAGAGGSGGAIAGSGDATIEGSTLTANSSGDGGRGGQGDGGQGGNSGGSAVGAPGGSGYGRPGGDGGSGGAIAGSGQISVTATTIARNRAGAGGGGGPAAGGYAGSASGATGGTGGGGTSYTGGRGGFGGAILTTGTLMAVNVTIDGNSAGPGGDGGLAIGGHGGPGISGGNGGATDTGNGGFTGEGGALYASGSANLTQVTITANAPGGASARGEVFLGLPASGGMAGQPHFGVGRPSGDAGAVYNDSGSVTARGTIFSDNGTHQCLGGLTDGGGNVQGPTAGGYCIVAISDPRLGVLQDNGGSVPTRALGTGSSAVGAQPSAGCTATDARGVARPAGAACDAGAFQRATPEVTTGGAGSVTQTGATLTGTVTANAADAGYRFDYGTTSAYGSSTPDASVTGGDASAAISGLAPGTTYHYRVVATTVYGTTAGADATFTTAAAPGGAGTGGKPTPDTTLPKLTSLKLTPAKFTLKKGTRITFKLSEKASVAYTIERKKGKRYTKVGTFTASAAAGADKLKWGGKVGKKKLTAGAYRVTLVATDAQGNHSKKVSSTFKVVRR